MVKEFYKRNPKYWILQPLKDVEDKDYGAGEVMIEVLEKLYNKIPKRGLNNMTRQKYTWMRKNPDEIPDWNRVLNDNEYLHEHYKLVPIPCYIEPTIGRRMERLCPTIFGSAVYLPWVMVMMANKEAKEKAKVLLKKIFDGLHFFTQKFGTVTVVEKEEIEEYRRRIQRLERNLMKTAEILGIVQDVEFNEVRKSKK